MNRVAVCITTRNRCAELARTLRELRRLEPAADEVLVVADGCTDGTVEMIRAEHRDIRVIVHAESRGSIPSRNELFAAASAEIVLSLDDDSYPVEPDFIAHLRATFADRPQLAVLCFPQRSEEFPATLTAASLGPSQYVGSFANSGAAIRRSVFASLGGFPAHFGHMYEEPDFALRCVSAGWQVWQDAGRTVRHHFTGSQRSELRNHQRHARNELWSVLMRCPAPQLLAVALFRVVRQFRYACSRGIGWTMREPQWWWAALAGARRCLAGRDPLPWTRYLAWMRLIGTPIATEADWRASFGDRPV